MKERQSKNLKQDKGLKEKKFHKKEKISYKDLHLNSPIIFLFFEQRNTFYYARKPTPKFKSKKNKFKSEKIKRKKFHKRKQKNFFIKLILNLDKILLLLLQIIYSILQVWDILQKFIF